MNSSTSNAANVTNVTNAASPWQQADGDQYLQNISRKIPGYALQCTGLTCMGASDGRLAAAYAW